ncbi:MAG: DEAD/DEAH box helicase [Paludibacteraceae bacterium]|nr:DEAD/DEAH box helicase [Paludibacteraceae bacterium]
MYFDELPISDELLDAVDAMNFTECTPVQEATIPLLLQGRDLIACAQTGTGKTAAYILPLLDNLLNDNHKENKINAIIMAPTRELAQQIDQQMEAFSYFLPFSSVAVYGGNDGPQWAVQQRGLQRGADVVIATPGRLLSHITNSNIDFSDVRYFILDEADRMLDMGFLDDIKKIMALLPEKRQNILFSATMPQDLRRLAKQMLHNPAEINIAISRPPESIKQEAYICYEGQKMSLLTKLLKEKKLQKVLVFVGKKQKVKEMFFALKKQGLNARTMYSDLTQQERDEVMLDYRNGKVDVLVATDIVSRGIDIDDIPLVVNYDVPHDVEDYVHRIGRTARAEADGNAITLVSEQDQRYFSKIEDFLGYDINKLPLPKELGEAPEYHPQKKTEKKRQARKTSYRKDYRKNSKNS